MTSIREHHDDYVYDFSVESTPDTPDLARRCLELLLHHGGLGASPDDSARSAEKGGQRIWLRRADVSTRGYRSVVVEDGLPRTVQGTLAALTVQEGWRADPERLKTILGVLDLTNEASTERSLSEAFEKLRELSSHERGEFISDLMAHRPLLFAIALLRHYRPDFDKLSREGKERLLIECYERVDEVLKSVRLLSSFLTHGGREKRQRAAWKDPHTAVKAALLKDVEGLKHHEIAEIARIDSPDNRRIKRDYPKVRQAIDRGRDILQRAYGPEGYEEIVASMKAELRQSLE
jgi:hypothetical protein